MSEVPAFLLSYLGDGPWLDTLCAGRGKRGSEVIRILDLSDTELSNGRHILSKPDLELVRGGLLYALDALSEAHEIFQENQTALGSYWHGMMHRREGDFSNACYWFHKAGNPSWLKRLQKFDPVEFTHSCSRAKGNQPDLLNLQLSEWKVLMELCFERSVGA